MRTLFFTILFLLLSVTATAQNIAGDTLSFDYVRTLQAVSEQQHYREGEAVDLLLTRCGATVQVTKIVGEDFIVHYIESFDYQNEAIFIFDGLRLEMTKQ